MRLAWVLLAVSLTACSSSSSANKETKSATTEPLRGATNKSNPFAKYIELAGFRINEKSPGKLEIQFAVVNHSEADIGDVKVNVNLGTTVAKPGDAPLVTFSAKVPSLGPSALKPVTVEVPTKLRVYELPDWQFLKVDFQITEPQ